MKKLKIKLTRNGLQALAHILAFCHDDRNETMSSRACRALMHQVAIRALKKTLDMQKNYSISFSLPEALAFQSIYNRDLLNTTDDYAKNVAHTVFNECNQFTL